MTQLSVNVNKIALLRNSRGNNYPNLCHMAERCIKAGSHGITVHPRQDQRHIKYSDIPLLAHLIKELSDEQGRSIEFNIEGYPSDEFIKTVKDHSPDQCTLVPDDPNQLTSDHGWDLETYGEKIKPIIHELQNENIRVSLFMDPDPNNMVLAKETGAQCIELYTEFYARAFENGDSQSIFMKFNESAEEANKIGLRVNAGHDLNLQNLEKFLSIKNISEVSIGHAIIVESFDYGLEETIKKYLDILA